MQIVGRTGKESLFYNSSRPPLPVSPFRWSNLLYHLLPLPYHSTKFLSGLELNHNSPSHQHTCSTARWPIITASTVETWAFEPANPSPLSSLQSNRGDTNGGCAVWTRFRSSADRFMHLWWRGRRERENRVTMCYYCLSTRLSESGR